MAQIDLKEDIRPLSEFRADAAGLLRRVQETKRPLVLTQRGHSSAIVLDIAEYQRLLDEVELLRDIHTAMGQLERDEGIEAGEARRLAHEGLRG